MKIVEISITEHLINRVLCFAVQNIYKVLAYKWYNNSNDFKYALQNYERIFSLKI